MLRPAGAGNVRPEGYQQLRDKHCKLYAVLRLRAQLFSIRGSLNVGQLLI